MRLLLGVLMLATLAYCQETCQSADEDPYLLFGTKTAYTFANKGIPVNRVHDVPGCQPMAIWLLNRHGSQNPEADEIDKLQKLTDLRNNIIANYKNGNFRNTNIRMCTADVNLLERWEWNPRQNTTFAGDLTSDGYISTQQLAQAWKQRFPGLLTDNRHDYLFKYVNDQRSTTTFRAFTEGLFRSQADSYDIPKENDEKLITPYKFCPAWTRQVEENNETLSQLRIFESKQEFKQMISNISLRMGFNYDVQREVIARAYDMCRYNKAWDVTQISPWCAIFSKDDLKRFEYAEDLETYYKYGYGNSAPVKQQIGCTGVKDMMDFFKIHVEHETPRQPRATVLLSPAAPLFLSLSALGGRRDHAPLTGDNYHSATAAARRWTSSAIAPYSANLAAVLYKCTPNSNFQINDEYQPYKFCPAWTRQVEENNETLSQLRIFESKQEFKQMISNISLRMGFNYDVQREVIARAYDMCRYNKAWDVTQISPWCAIFSKDDLKRFEYAEDLETYYKYGYGNSAPVKQQIGCTGVKDMMDFFKIHVEHETPRQPRATVLLSPAAPLFLSLSALGGRRDHAPLTGDNYHSATAAARRWTSSAIAPYSANLAAVLYKCTPNSNFQINDEYQVLFLENERPLYLDGCRVGLCDWTFVKNHFGVIADNCNLNLCNSAAKINSAIWLSLGLFAFLTKYVF